MTDFPHRTLFSVNGAAIKPLYGSEWVKIPYVCMAQYEPDKYEGHADMHHGVLHVFANALQAQELATILGRPLFVTPEYCSFDLYCRDADEALESVVVRLDVRAIGESDAVAHFYFYSARPRNPFDAILASLETGKLADMSLVFDCFYADHDENGKSLNVMSVGRFDLPL